MTKQYILDRVKVDEETGCWEWQLYKNAQGYGKCRTKGFSGRSAHRLSYIVYKGEIPKGMLVCHSCDNPGCVNPEHLRTGTHQDNADDKMRRGRYISGQATKTHCKRGHEFTEENTYIREYGRRVCRSCASMRARNYRRKRRQSSDR